MIPLLLTLACGQADPSPSQVSPQVAQQLAVLSDRVAHLEADLQTLQEGAKGTVSARRMDLIDERMTRVELAISELQNDGVVQARYVSFDPRAGTLGVENAQDALEGIESRLHKVEQKLSEDMGDPGPGLFAVPDDGRSGQPGPPPGHQQRGPGGQQGGPPGGQQGGQQGNPPPGGHR